MSVVEGGSASHGFMRGRNGKWFRAGRGTIGIGRVNDVCEFVPRIERECVRDGDVTVRRGGVNRKKGAIGGELAADFIFFDIEETGDVFDHLLMGQSHFRISWAFRGRRGDNVGSIVSVIDWR